MTRTRLLLLSLSAALALATGVAATRTARSAPEGKSKYGRLAVPLSRDHAFLREAAAPDFWALAPYAVGQRDDRSCSLAVVTMLVNAARAPRDLGSEDELALQDAVLERSGSAAWRGDLGALGVGVTLDELEGFTKLALAAYGVTVTATRVLHADVVDDALRRAAREMLVENERSARDFLLANFDQGRYTSDASAGHMAPVAAYDEARRRVLLLDPDRRWYEPYWVSEETFLEGLATKDPVARKGRGLLWVKLAAE